MRCPFCAEEIQDAAVVCRFCGATKAEGHWVRGQPPPRGSGFVLRSSAALFVVAAVWELIPPTAPVPLCGALRGGMVAVVEHVVFATVFLVLGVGLWQGRRWVVRALVAGAILYTAAKGAYLLDAGARQAELRSNLGAYPELDGLLDTASIDSLQRLMAAVAILGLWLFVLYVYHRRENLG